MTMSRNKFGQALNLSSTSDSSREKVIIPPHFLRLDGTSSMSADLNIGGNNIKNVKKIGCKKCTSFETLHSVWGRFRYEQYNYRECRWPLELNHAVNRRYCDQNVKARREMQIEVVEQIKKHVQAHKQAYAPRFAKFDITGDILFSESLSKNWNNAITVSKGGDGLQVQEDGVYMCYVSILLEVPAAYRNSYVMVSLKQPKGSL